MNKKILTTLPVNFNKENLKKIAAALVAVIFAIYGKKKIGARVNKERTNSLKHFLAIIGLVITMVVLAVLMLKEFFNKYGEDDFDDDFEYWYEEDEIRKAIE